MPAWMRCSTRGLVEETRELLKHGLEQNKTAMQAIGYRQVVEHLRGERSLAETIELVKIRTRQFAKRQLTWFRAQTNLEWIELKPDESVGKAVVDLRRRLTPLERSVICNFMSKVTYTVSEAQANLPGLCRSGRRFVISRRTSRFTWPCRWRITMPCWKRWNC